MGEFLKTLTTELATMVASQSDERNEHNTDHRSGYDRHRVAGFCLPGSWARLRREKRGENQQAQKLTIEDAGMPPSIASAKFIALDGAHSLEPRDIVNILQHGAPTTHAMRR